MENFPPHITSYYTRSSLRLRNERGPGETVTVSRTR
jgi:hypothetical protein